jgi:hypothetical protein
MPEPWAAATKEKEAKENVRLLFGEEPKEIRPDVEVEEEEDSQQADAELLAAFNRVVNINSTGRGDILPQGAEAQGRISPAPEYHHRAYQPVLETISHQLANDLDYPDRNRSGSPPTSFAEQHRQRHVRSRPPRSPGITNTGTLPLTEHELDEPVHPVSPELYCQFAARAADCPFC